MNASIKQFFSSKNKILPSTQDCFKENEDIFNSQITFKKRNLKKEDFLSAKEIDNFEFKDSVKKEEETQEQRKVIEKDIKTELVDFNEEIQFKDETLEWARPENMKDKNMRRPTDPDYDPTKLYIPQSALDKLTPARRQYWEIKAQNFDKLILFKLGKFYELFEEDAVLAVKYLDLNFMGEKRRAGFPEQALEKFLPWLINKGIKVAIVEQTETDKELMERIQREKPQKHLRILKREMIDVQTIGTYYNNEDEIIDFKHIWNITSYQSTIVLLISNLVKNEYQINSFNQDNLSDVVEFKLLFTNKTPSEIIYSSTDIPETFQRIIKSQGNNVLISINRLQNKQSNLQAFQNLCKNEFKISQEKISKITNQIIFLNEEKQQIFIDNLTRFFLYLNSILLLDKALVSFNFTLGNQQIEENNFLFMNSQSLEHLEICQSSKGIEKYSLYWLINKCITTQGKWLLKKWIQKPLFQIEEIKERQNAIQNIGENQELKNKLQIALKKVNDLERSFHFLSKYCVEPKVKVIFFSDQSSRKINELFNYFQNIQQAEQVFNILWNYSSQINSKILQDLILTTPNAEQIVENLKNSIQWENGIPYPVQGFSLEFDNISQKINEINLQVNQHIEEIKQQTGIQSIELCRGKYWYEIKVDSKYTEKINEIMKLEFCSKIKGFDKFVTEFLKNKIFEIEHLEDQQKHQLYLFSSQIFAKFNEYKETWLKISENIAILDSICSLAEYSFQPYSNLIKPIFIQNEKSYIKSSNLKHPVLQFKDSEFVGNDILLDNEKRTIVLTGPNMGGKSTLMRTLATNIVLAQIGCHVSADHFEISPFDRIFTWIGASDKLEEHKSTFYIEMEETLTIIQNATNKSLCLIDELGRGTSTYDGYSIAASVLNHIIKNIDCITLFATHYQFIKEDIISIENKILFNQMGYDIISQESQKIKFLYKIFQGICEKSFALNVARLSGIPESIIERAIELTNIKI